MHEQPSSYHGPKVTGENDPRLTRVGAWLRDTKLNEFPQLWNVLIGEMSLVGPRPEDPDIVESWPEDKAEEILSIRPGITSPASVLFRDEETMLPNETLMETYLGIIQPDKLRLDQLYVRNRSLWVDIDILLWTFLVLFPGLAKFKPPERLLFRGLIFRGADYFLRWFIIDFFIALVAVSSSALFWRTLGPFHVGFWRSIGEAVEFAVVFTLVGAVIGIQKIQWTKASPADVLDLAVSTVISTGILLFVNLFQHRLPAIPIISGAVLSFLGMVIARYRYRLITGLASRWLKYRKGGKVFQERLLIIGSGDAGSYAAWMLSNSKEALKFNVIGYVDDDFEKHGVRYRGAKVLGTTKDIEKIVQENDVGIIIFAIHKISEQRKAEILEVCRNTNAQVVILPDVIGTLSEIVDHDGDGDEADAQSKKLEAYITSNGREESLSSFAKDKSDILALIKELQQNLEQSEIEKCFENISMLENMIKQHLTENTHDQ